MKYLSLLAPYGIGRARVPDMTLTESLLLAIAVAAVAAAVAAVVVVVRIARVAAEVERLTGEVRATLPRVERVLEGAERELARFDELADRADRIASDVETVSKKAMGAVVPALDLAAGLSKPVRYINAAITGIGVAMTLLRRWRDRSERDDGSPEEGAAADGRQEGDMTERKEVTP